VGWQLGFFETGPVYPDGFRYEDGVISKAQESELIASFADLPFKEFEFQGYVGKRRTVSFGWRYDFNQRVLERTHDIPDFLLSLRESAARRARSGSGERSARSGSACRSRRIQIGVSAQWPVAN
jgi:hypothetical protein